MDDFSPSGLFAAVRDWPHGQLVYGQVIGAVSDHLSRLPRAEIAGRSWDDHGAVILVPGYGAQGGGGREARASFRADGSGAVVNSSRGIIYAGGAEDFPQASADAARAMRDAITEAQEARRR